MWPFDYLSFLNPWSTPPEPFRYNLRPITTTAPLYRRVLELGPSAGTKRKRPIPFESHSAKRARLGLPIFLTPEEEAALATETPSERAYDSMDGIADGGLRDQDEIEYEFGSPVPWDDAVDLVPPTADDADVAALARDAAYAAFRGPEPTGTPEVSPAPEIDTAGPATATTPGKRAKASARVLERRERTALANEVTKDWHPKDALLFLKLQLRGYEPLLPKSWEVDFPGLPAALFTKHERIISIKAYGWDDEAGDAEGKDVRGARALRDLLDLGTWVRDMLKYGKETVTRPETRVKRVVERYLQWSVRDAGLYRPFEVPPVCVVVEDDLQTEKALMEEVLVRELSKLKVNWARELGHEGLPRFYGIMCSREAMVVASLKDQVELQVSGDSESDGNPVKPPSQLRTIALLRWTRPGQDVWNAMAVALLASLCREMVLDLLEKIRPMKQAGSLDSSSVQADSD